MQFKHRADLAGLFIENNIYITCLNITNLLEYIVNDAAIEHKRVSIVDRLQKQQKT